MRSKSWVLASAAALIAALAIPLFVASDPRPTGDGDRSAPDRGGAGRRGQDLLSAPKPPEDASRSSSPQTGRIESPQATPSTAPEAELVEVEIVRGDTREPVPEASVGWWPRTSFVGGGEDFEKRPHESSGDGAPGAGREFRADSQGRVQVPDAPRGFFLEAASGDLWGRGSFEGGLDRPATLEIFPERDMRVQVVDGKGSPAVGVPVALRQRRGNATFDHLTARTAEPDGVAVLRHAGRFLRARSDPTEPFLAAVPGIFDPPLEACLDLARPASEVVKLVLPPTGSCEVLVVDEQGEPVAGPFEARLSFVEESAGGPSPGKRRCTETLLTRSGERVVFEQVGLGRALTVAVRREGSGALAEVVGRGPSSPEERVSLRVTVGLDVAILRGRALDSAGKPVARAALRARLGGRDPAATDEAGWLLRSDEGGRFCLDVAPMPDVPEGMALAICRLSEDGAEIAVGRRALPAELRAGSHHLGDFALADTQIAAAGIVVDAGGEPVARATVTPTIPLPRTEGVREARLPKCWLVPARTDARGRFEIRGEVESDRVSLLAEKKGLVGDPVEVRAGARDARLVLGAAGGIEGTVLLDSSLLDSIVLAHAFRKTPESPREVASSEKPAVVGRDGRFSLRGLEGGTHSVRLVYAATGTEIGRVEDITVREGETARDPRFDPLDLRGSFRLIELELADERGQLVSQGRAYSRPSGEADARWTYARAEGGRLKLLRDDRPLDVAITSPGFLRTELDRVTDSQRATLRRAASVRLELAGGLAVPEPPLFLGAALTPVQPGRFLGFVDSSEAYFDASGVLRCETPFVGDLRVEVFATRRDKGAAPRAYVEEQTPPIVSLAEHAIEQVFTIRLDPARLEAAVRSVREEH